MASLWATALLLISGCICSSSKMTAKEGSCVKILCTRSSIVKPASAVWLKDPKWNDKTKDFEGVVVHSLKADKPAESKFKNRVSVSTVNRNPELTISNLRQEDSGIYLVRYYGENDKWTSKDNVSLLVEENPCQVSVTGPEVVQEGERVNLSCSTWGPCKASPVWQSSAPGWESRELSDGQGRKTAEQSFEALWSHDGATFSCWPPGGSDDCASKSVRLAVEYSPRETTARVDHPSVKKGGGVTFTCHSKANPQPQFLWFKEGQGETTQGGEWKLHNVRVEHAGSYSCQAKNKLGAQETTVITLDVTYAPKLGSITQSKTLDRITEGDGVSLICNVQSSNPREVLYSWYQYSTLLRPTGQILHFTAIQPKDKGDYYCRATNTVGFGDSPKFLVTVYYGPRDMRIKASCCETGVKAGQSLSLTCETNANPAACEYTWFRAVKPTRGVGTPDWTKVPTRFSRQSDKRDLTWEQIRPSNAGEYMCQAVNNINAKNSSSLHVDVLYRPTGLTLSMAPTVIESDPVTVHCTAESYPPSTLTLTWAPPSSLLPNPTLETPYLETLQGRSTDHSVRANLTTSFTATVGHAGLYTCQAANSEGQDQTSQELVVNYSPRDVRATANPRGEVAEKTNLNLSCQARAIPSVSRYTWFRLRGWRAWEVGSDRVMSLRKLSELDAGMYFCRTRNEIGEGNSSFINVTVKYGPRKPVVIHNMTSRGQPASRSPVGLTCSSKSYPPIRSYKWYIQEDVNKERFLAAKQNLTIDPEQGGVYYCFVDNGISSSSSDKIEIRFGRSSSQIAILAVSCISSILILVLIIVLVCRKWRKSTQQSLQNGSRNGTRETLVMDGMGDTQRSRESLSAAVAPPLQPPANQHGPGGKPCSSVTTVYSALATSGKRKQSPRPPRRDRAGPAEVFVADYASLQFPGRRNTAGLNPEEPSECVYSIVSKPKLKKKEEEEAEYENVKGAVPRRKVQDTDTETSEEDADVSYTTVSFEPGAGRQAARPPPRHHSDTSDEDDYATRYSVVKA